MKYNIVIVILSILFSASGCAQQAANNDHVLLKKLFDIVEENHLAPQKNDAQLSKKTMDSFLKKLDPEKKVFTKKEVRQLKKAQTTLADAYEGGSSQFFEQTTALFQKGIARAKEFPDDFLDKDLAIFEEEYLESNSDKIEFAKNEKALKNHWGLLVKKQYLEELFIAEIANPTLNFQEHKAIALNKTKVFFKDELFHMGSQTKAALIEVYANSYLTNIDYQSNFLSPKSKADWDAKFNREFVGVGVHLETTIDYPRIARVFYDGPAWKTKRIHAGNTLLKIADKDNTLIDIAGFPLKKVIDLLKGEKGSSVQVVVRNSENEMEEVSIKRGTVAMSLATSFLLEDQLNNRKIGYIHLPRFYVGADGCASHVLAKLEQLKKEHVEGVIIDLRNNHGGSASETREMLGYFLDGGVVMQAKYADGEIRTSEDSDPSVQYDGKVVVMVNESSSSASELFAGTMQDYERAIVVGNQTFGKGTMQRFFEVLDDRQTKLGVVKLSTGSFYSGKGRSNQYHGVTPDIVFPSKSKYLKTGERKVANALKFEDLATIQPSNSSFKNSLTKIKTQSNSRLQNDQYFQQIEQAALLEKDKQEKSLVNLNYTTFKSEKEKLKSTKTTAPKIANYQVSDLPSTSEKEKTAFQKRIVENDKFVYESLLIMNDYLLLDRVTESKNG